MRSKRGLESIGICSQGGAQREALPPSRGIGKAGAVPSSAHGPDEESTRGAVGSCASPCEQNQSDLFTVKTPTGQLIKSSCRSLKAEAIEDYVFSMVHHGLLADRKDWYGPAYVWRYWLQLRRAGYTVARIRVTIHVDEESGWQIPELQEVAA